MALGLILCALVNVLLGFSNSFYAYVGFVISLGFFKVWEWVLLLSLLQTDIPKKSWEFTRLFWNISHNIGDEIVAPIVSLSGFALAALLGVSMADFNETYWHMNHFYVPATCAVIISLYVLYAVKGSPKNEGLVDISEINEMRGIKTEEIKAVETPNLSSFEIFYRYVLKNKNAWYVAWMDTFVLWCVLGLFLGFLFTY